MIYLMRAMSAELLKTKRTLAFWMTLVTPSVVCILQFLILMRVKGGYGGEGDAWIPTAQNIFGLWAILALPLFITLETALLAQVEHSEKHWKHLFALPIPRWATYAAKWFTGAILLLLGQVFLMAATLAIGYLARWLKPEIGFGPSAPLGWIAQVLGEMFLIALLMHSIHTWISLHFRSFTVAVGVGMAAAVSNIILINAEEGPRYFPWALTVNALPQNQGAALGYALAVGIAGAVLIALLGAWEVTRRDVL